ncbi:MAG TPA: hypothetical protein EYP59_16935 [Thiotrichaceae bacterium]|nr:hypothetical protein [Thiotrichaceae bacterium]
MKLSTLQQQQNRFEMRCALHQKKRTEAEIAETKRLIESSQLQLVNTKLTHFGLLTSKSSELDIKAQIERLRIQAVLKDHEGHVLAHRASLLEGQSQLRSLKSATGVPTRQTPDVAKSFVSPEIAAEVSRQIEDLEQALDKTDDPKLKQEIEKRLAGFKQTFQKTITEAKRVSDAFSQIAEVAAPVTAQTMLAGKQRQVERQVEDFYDHFLFDETKENEAIRDKVAFSHPCQQIELPKLSSKTQTAEDVIEEPVTAEIAAKVSQKIERLEETIKKTDDPKLKQEYEKMLESLQRTFQKRLAASDNTATESPADETFDDTTTESDDDAVSTETVAKNKAGLVDEKPQAPMRVESETVSNSRDNTISETVTETLDDQQF